MTLVVSAALLFSAAAGAHTTRRAAAKAQYNRAEKLRQQLSGKSEDQWTLADYKKLVAAYRRVYLITPRAEEVTPSLMAVAQLYERMGERFGKPYFESSLVTYKFLLSQYPSSMYRSEALFAVARIEKEDLHEPAQAKRAFTLYLKRFPHSSHADAARQALAEPDGRAPKPAIRAVHKTEVDTTAAARTPLPAGEAPAAGKYGPASRVVDIRTWNADDYTRVVVDLSGDVKYDSARIKNPDRIYFDLYKARLGKSITEKELPLQNGFLKSVRVAQNKIGVVRLVLDVNSVKGYSAFLLPDPYRLVIDVHGTDARADTAKAKVPIGPGKLAGDRRARKAATGGASPRAHPDVAAVAAQPMRDGDRSLTRALGLKIRRIVIDPGHGGYDTGTIGPNGLTEKKVCLDVALRLGRLIRRHLPGARVYYTRKKDVFVPLEERTAIANEDKADLFISIHANSSPDRAARGVETYYLSFTTSPEALEVASRENALSNASIHQLQDLIKQIARNDKIEESRELATDIQDSLSSKLERVSTKEKNRGVKKAPFVVLIGANMPSVLCEISFLSNPTDDRLLEHSAERERIADGIFRGIERYLSSLNSLRVDRSRQRLVTDRQPEGGTASRNPN